jgi:uncharacterized lipoprotein NlpE involved in copper resistance
MKKNVFMLGVILLIVGMSACKSKERTEPATLSSVINWQGTYTGTLPCADCPGIQTQITLFADRTYKMDRQYIDREENVYTEAGTFHWNESEGIITLNDSKDAPYCYKVGANTLTQMDMECNVITGKLAENYVLVKQ